MITFALQPFSLAANIAFDRRSRENDGTENDGTENDGTENDGTENDGTENDGTENDGTERELRQLKFLLGLSEICRIQSNQYP